MLAVAAVATLSAVQAAAGGSVGQQRGPRVDEANPWLVRRFEQYTQDSCESHGCWPLETTSNKCVSAMLHVFQQNTTLVIENNEFGGTQEVSKGCREEKKEREGGEGVALGFGCTTKATHVSVRPTVRTTKALQCKTTPRGKLLAPASVAADQIQLQKLRNQPLCAPF